MTTLIKTLNIQNASLTVVTAGRSIPEQGQYDCIERKVKSSRI